MYIYCLSYCLVAVQRHHDQGDSYKEKCLFNQRLAYSFRGLVHYHQGEEHGGTEADMVLDKELRVVHQDPQAAWEERTGPSRDFWNLTALSQ